MTWHPARLRNLTAPLVCCVIAACGGDSTSSAPPSNPGSPAFAIVKGPTLRPNPNPAVPLAALISLETDEPSQVHLQISDGTITWPVVAESEYGMLHDAVPVLGMRPGRMHSISVTARNRSGTSVTAPNLLTFTTPPLPASFPPIDVRASHPQRMESGVTLLGVANPSLPMMLDAAGEVVWYLDPTQIPEAGNAAGSAHRQPNGNLLMFVARSGILEIDMLGNVVTSWYAANVGTAPAGAIPVATDSFHHEVLPLPPGEAADFLALSSEVRVYPNYPSDVVDPTQVDPMANVVGDVIVEFRRDGTIVRETRLLDVLDPYRLCYDSLLDFWNSHYGMVTRDWCHANAVFIDPNDDSYIVSLRHQDAVVKIDRTTGALIWILGDHDRWQAPWSDKLLAPVGAPFQWQYHQHAPELGASGTLLMFDNGNHRAVPPATPMELKESYSRAVEFRVDAVARTVEQVWAYGGRGLFFSFFFCDADRLAQTGNVLVCDGGHVISPTLFNRYARIAEVSNEPLPKVLFEVIIGDPNRATPGGTSVYRAYRLPSVYPD